MDSLRYIKDHELPSEFAEMQRDIDEQFAQVDQLYEAELAEFTTFNVYELGCKQCFDYPRRKNRALGGGLVLTHFEDVYGYRPGEWNPELLGKGTPPPEKLLPFLHTLYQAEAANIKRQNQKSQYILGERKKDKGIQGYWYDLEGFTNSLEEYFGAAIERVQQDIEVKERYEREKRRRREKKERERRMRGVEDEIDSMAA